MITINSFGTELNKDDRAKLYPNCGKLFPDGLAKLAKAEDYDQVRQTAEYVSVSVVNYKYVSLILNKSQPVFACFKVNNR